MPEIFPQPLRRRRTAFDDPDYLFELKYDGYRALARVANGRCVFVSRNGNPLPGFTALGREIANCLPDRTVIDGEIVCVDTEGRPQFKDLLFHRGDASFFAFDLIMHRGRDLRTTALVERKQDLRLLFSRIPKGVSVAYVDHVDSHGVALFDRVCAMDLEGVVAKLKHGNYAESREESTWFKIKNLTYTQGEGREELFNPSKHGWHTCAAACEEMEFYV